MTTNRGLHSACEVLASRRRGANNAGSPFEARALTPARTPLPHILDADEPAVADALFSAPFGLTKLSRVEVEEPAYLCDSE